MNFSAKMLRDDALNGKVIVITGGGSGLGKAMTKYFMELGAKVAITSRDIEKLKTTSAELEAETGGTCLPVQCDVRQYEEVEAMLQEVLKAHGKVDVLLNNAAGNFISPTERLSANAFDTIIDIVLKGSKNCTLAFGKHWIDTKQEADGEWYVYLNGGTVATKTTCLAWAQEAAKLGAGEILLTSMNHDGTKAGFALDITRAVSKAVSIPVIASGGGGTMAHFEDVFTTGAACAGCRRSLNR